MAFPNNQAPYAPGMYLYGRAYNVTIGPSSANPNKANESPLTVASDQFEPYALKIEFDVQTAALSRYWQGVLKVTNLSGKTLSQLFSQAVEGQEVKISAGYKGTQRYGQIYQGYVYQPLFDRMNVVDNCLELYMTNGFLAQDMSLINVTVAGGTNYYNRVKQMIKSNVGNAKMGTISENLPKKVFPRNYVAWGSLQDHLDIISRDDTNSQWFFSKGTDVNATVLSLDVTKGLLNGSGYKNNPTFTISPQNGLIGTPQMTDQGILLTTLMNPNIKIQSPLPVVQLDESIVRQMQSQFVPGSNSSLPYSYMNPLSTLDQNGQYIITGVRHYGCNRGNDWYTELRGVSYTFRKNAIFAVNQGGGSGLMK